MIEKIHFRRHLSSFQIIILSFAGIILFGALILMLPISSAAGIATPFHSAIFTSTSAVCVTGLVVLDTGSYWSPLGQAVILLLIQIGGLGVVTAAVSFAMLAGRKISLMQRSTMQDAISAPRLGGIVRLTRFVLRGTLLIELIGALCMLPSFCGEYGASGIWKAVFHSVSAFCNAGFDILGTGAHTYPSLTEYIGNPSVNIAIMLLIIVGGIGFLTWDDICLHKHHFRRYRMQSKSVTTRTAGFNTADLNAMTGASKAIMTLLMLIGGSPGSTAGGIKTTTFAVIILSAVSVIKRKEEICVCGRRIDNTIIRNALAIATIYFSLFFVGGVAISVLENLPLSDCLYETASAIGTVGLTLGITPKLGIASQIILILLMYLGRVGGLTLIYSAIAIKNQGGAKLPLEKIMIG